MYVCYWDLNPRSLFQKNSYSEKIVEENGGNIPDNVKELFDVYEEYSFQCMTLQNTITQANFKEVMEMIFELEAQLSEIAFYLEKVDLSLIEENLHELIKDECLLDYYENLANSYNEGYFLVSSLREKVKKQRDLRFGNDVVSLNKFSVSRIVT